MVNLEFLSIGKCAEILKDETFEYNGTECVVVSDAEECYRQGYKDATDKACEWLKENSDYYIEHWDEDTWINSKLYEDFRKAMEE